MGQTYRIDSDFEVIGEWFLPKYGFSSSTTGKLIFKDSKIRLQLYGSFDDFNENAVEYGTSELKKETYIFGFSQDGCTIIIENAIVVDWKMSVPGMKYTEYSTNRCLVMEINYSHFGFGVDQLCNMLVNEGIDNISCKSCNFSIKDMNLWMNSSAIKSQLKDKYCSIYYDLSEVETDTFTVRDRNLLYSNDVICKRDSNRLSEEYFWILKGKNGENITLKELKTSIDVFKNLLQFFVESPTEYTFINFKIAVEGENEKTISAHYIQSQYKSKVKTKVSVHYTDIKEKLASILENWYNKNDKLSLIIENYLNDVNTNYFSNTKLLNAIKNLEIYHRKFKDIQEDRQINSNLEQYKMQLINYIKKNIDDKEVKYRFIRNIKYNPDMTLHKRLSELFEELDFKVQEEFFQSPNKTSKDNRESIITSLVETRNYYTHGDDKNKYLNMISDTLEQLNMTSILNQIIKYYIYKELEMLDDDIIKAVVGGKKNYTK